MKTRLIYLKMPYGYLWRVLDGTSLIGEGRCKRKIDARKPAKRCMFVYQYGFEPREKAQESAYALP